MAKCRRNEWNRSFRMCSRGEDEVKNEFKPKKTKGSPGCAFDEHKLSFHRLEMRVEGISA